MRELAAQFLALAETQGAVVPLMIGHRLMGTSLMFIGELGGRPGAPRSGDRALRSCRASSAGDAIWPRRQDRNLNHSVDARSGCLAIPRPRSQTRTTRSRMRARSGHAATLMYALFLAIVTPIVCGNYAAAKLLADELLALADEKGAPGSGRPRGRISQGEVLALTGKAADAVQMITSGITAFRSTGATLYMPRYFSYLAIAYAQLGQFDDAWRCVDEAMTAVETTKERWCEAEVNRIAGEVALSRRNRMRRKRKSISRARLRLRVGSRPSPGNYARR